MRLTFTKEELVKLKIALSGNTEMTDLLNSKIRQSALSLESVANKQNATKNANAAKLQKSKKKIENAINLLRMENKKITVYSVSQVAKVSFNTAKKYKEFIDSQSE